MTTDDLLDIAKKYGTPFYIFDYDSLIARVKAIRAILPRHVELCYAVKANPFLIEPLKKSGILFEVCSAGELSICQKLNVNVNQIVFSGVCKELADIKRAYDLNVHTITLESRLHCQYLVKTISEAKTTHDQNVILRFTSGNQFGMSKSDIKSCIKDLCLTTGVKIRGIHYFTGTQKKIKKIQEEVQFITDFCDSLKQECGIEFSDIEYGAGISFEYFSKKDEAENFDDLRELARSVDKTAYHFVIELGRFIAAPCGKYVSQILDLKSNEEANYCLIDGGINHINYYGQILGMKIPPMDFLFKHKNIQGEGYTICGSLCTTADVIAKNVPLPNPVIGDFIVFNNIGAYAITESLYLFLSHPLPAVFSYENSKPKLLRDKQETYILNC